MFAGTNFLHVQIFSILAFISLINAATTSIVIIYVFMIREVKEFVTTSFGSGNHSYLLL